MENFYFAYGSNMNIEQMKRRCPGAEEASPAVLHGWKLAERLYADIEKGENECVNGALYFVTDDDIAALDQYEGYPEFYTREKVLVADNTGCLRSAWVYTMTEKYKKIRSGEKYPECYRRTCSDGAKYWGIPNAFSAPGNTDCTLFADGLPNTAEGLDMMLKYINSSGPLPRAKSLWQGADVIITLKKQNIQSDFYPAPFEVYTVHALELSWVFNDLRDLFMKEKLLDCRSKDVFFGELAECAVDVLEKDPHISAHHLCGQIVQQAMQFYKQLPNHAPRRFFCCTSARPTDESTGQILK